MASSALVRDAKKLFANGGVLPADVLYEVLLRVPAMALCRLRLVCRSWRSITSDPGFAMSHSSRHPLLVVVGLDRRYDARFSDEMIHIVDLHSCNAVRRIHLGDYYCWSLNLKTQAGLIYAVVSTPMTRGSSRYHVLVINPTTGAVKDAIALPDGDMAVPPSMAFVLSYHVPVLGHVPSTGDYKVLRFSCYKYYGAYGVKMMVCEVMTLGGGCDKTWRVKPSPHISEPLFEGKALVHGVAYVWWCECSSHDLQPDVALFDLATEEWAPTTLRGPLLSKNGVDFVYDDFQSAVLDGCLVIVHHKRRGCSTDLWFLTDVNNGVWTKRYSMRRAPHWESLHPRPLAVLDDGRMVAWLAGQRALKSYDPWKDAWTHLGSMDYYSIQMYQGSLLRSYLPG